MKQRQVAERTGVLRKYALPHEVTVLQLFALLQLHPVTVTSKLWIRALDRQEWPAAAYLDGVLRQKEVQAGPQRRHSFSPSNSGPKRASPRRTFDPKRPL